MASKLDNTWNFLASLMPSAWHSAASLYTLLAWSMAKWGEGRTGVSMPAGQVLDTWWDPVMLGTLCMRLPRPATGCPGRLKPWLVWREASEHKLSSDMDHRCHGVPSPRGVDVMEGGWSTVALLWDPIGLWKPSNPLELTGRVELSSQMSSVRVSFCLHPSDSAGGVGDLLHL